MNLSRKFFPLAALAAAALLVASAIADARPSSGGSRGSRTFSAPAATNTAPKQAAPLERTMTQPGRPSTPTAAAPAANTGGFFSRPGLMGGLAAGFLGAGLFGLLAGNGMFGGMGGIASFIGLLLQVALVVIVARLLWAWWQRRNGGLAFAAPGQNQPNNTQRSFLNGGGLGGGLGAAMGGGASAAASAPSQEIEIGKEDYDAFEESLGQIQAAYSREDLGALRRLVTPEMAMYFSEDLAANASRGVRNDLADVKLLQGDLSEAWRENNTDYATLAMRFSLVDRMVDRDSGKVVEGGPAEAVELWTFMRGNGGRWILSAIQDAG
jgi:predicted lipid-binding transport protein (Tim44 family)